MPTRLLDWSESVLVAAYFAVKDGPIIEQTGPKHYRKADGLIYGFQAPKEVKPGVVESRQDAEALDEPVLLRPPHLSGRITVQKGVLTIHNMKSVPWNPENLWGWKIPYGRFLTLKKALDRCGINEATLFPDLDGIARHIGWQNWRGR